jgi:hypothetical protein
MPCATCKFYDRRDCKVYPPQVIYDYTSDTYESLWPEVEPTDWCGQWEAQDGTTQSKRGL